MVRHAGGTSFSQHTRTIVHRSLRRNLWAAIMAGGIESNQAFVMASPPKREGFLERGRIKCGEHTSRFRRLNGEQHASLSGFETHAHFEMISYVKIARPHPHGNAPRAGVIEKFGSDAAVVGNKRVVWRRSRRARHLHAQL